MIEVNVAPRNYQYRMQLRSDRSDNIQAYDYLHNLNLKITWGNAYSTGFHGVELDIRNTYDPLRPPGEEDRFYVIINTPSYSNTSAPDFVWYSITDWYYVKLYGVTLTIDEACENWDFHWDSLEIYHDDVLLHSEGSFTDGGSLFDRRLTATLWNSNPTISLPGGATYEPNPGEPEGIIQIVNTSKVGEQHDLGSGWESFDVNWYAPTNTPEPVMGAAPCDTCECIEPEPIPWVEIDVDNESWLQIIHDSNLYYELDHGETTNIECYCEDEFGVPCGIPGIYQSTEHYYLGYYPTLAWKVAPTDAPFLDFQRLESSFCNCDFEPPATDPTTDEYNENLGFTTISYTRLLSYRERTFYSNVILFTPSCCVGGEPPATCSPPWVTCRWDAESHITWDPLECNPYIEKDLTIIAPLRGELMKGYIDADDNLWIKWVKHNLPPYTKVIQVTSSEDCSSPWLAYHDGYYLGYNRGTDAYFRISYDFGSTWSTAVANLSSVTSAVGRYSNGRFLHAGIRVTAGPIYKIAAKYQGPGDASPGSEFFFQDDASADIEIENERFDLDFSGDHCILTCKISGETQSSEWVSYDHDCSTWKRVS